MMDERFEKPFKVIFFDGNSTMDAGGIFVHPYLNFKAFQSMVSQRIGVSPNQITTYYERGSLPSPSGKFLGGNRRSPVTSKFNFASIRYDSNCFFFVVLKRSRRIRNRNKKKSLLDHPAEGYNYNYRFPNPNFPNYGELEYVEKEYVLSRYLNSMVYSDGTSDDGASTSSHSGGVCEECEIAKKQGQRAEFHCCKCDPILSPCFRSPFGPIARPARTTNSSSVLT